MAGAPVVRERGNHAVDRVEDGAGILPTRAVVERRGKGTTVVEIEDARWVSWEPMSSAEDVRFAFRRFSCRSPNKLSLLSRLPEAPYPFFLQPTAHRSNQSKQRAGKMSET